MRPKLVINAAAGRMGKRILSLAIDAGEFEIIAGIEKKGHPDIGKDIGLLAGKGPINLALTGDLPAAGDIMIDFSVPGATDRCVEFCLETKTSLVIGTTGLSDEQAQKIKAASDKIPIVKAANMSVGMNVLFGIAGKVARMLGEDYDIEIVEAHHRFKKDAPSGTALTLAENIAAATKRPWPDWAVYGRSGKQAQRKKGKIGIHAVRAGGITGQHNVIFGASGETVTLSHAAHSRDTFAAGALRAAMWLTKQKPGLYSMADVLGLG